MSDYRKLRVWAAAQDLAIQTYQLTSSYPRAEEYGMKSQMRRAAVSIAANLAEGSGRYSKKDFTRFIRFASGSASELECLAHLSAKLDLLPEASSEHIATEAAGIRKMLAGLASSLR